MAVNFVDQVAAFLAVGANQSGFPAQIGLSAFATWRILLVVATVSCVEVRCDEAGSSGAAA